MSAKKETLIEPKEDGVALGDEPKVETKAEPKVEAKAEPKAMVKKKSENLMYLGPTIAGAIRHGTVLKEGKKSKKVQECIETLPIMERLFVCEKDVSRTVKELSMKQSALVSIYNKVAQTFIRR